MGRTPTANAFVRYYETQFYPNYDEETGSRKEFGGYTFVPPKKGDTTPLVPVYQNKWDDWTNYWFYLGLATQEGMEESVTSNLPKANVFVSQMTPMAGFGTGNCFWILPKTMLLWLPLKARVGCKLAEIWLKKVFVWTFGLLGWPMLPSHFRSRMATWDRI